MGVIEVTYGEHAQKIREDCGYTKARLARAAGIDADLLGKLEIHDRLPRLHTLLCICRALGITPDQYLGIEPKRDRWDRRTGSIGSHACAIRLRRGMTMAELAEKSLIGYPTIRTFEQGTRRVSTSVVLALAEALDVSLDEYLGLPCPEERYLYDL
jgi:transcriptional regulator with XRE-family HTH domain